MASGLGVKTLHWLHPLACRVFCSLDWKGKLSQCCSLLPGARIPGSLVWNNSDVQWLLGQSTGLELITAAAPLQKITFTAQLPVSWAPHALITAHK